MTLLAALLRFAASIAGAVAVVATLQSSIAGGDFVASQFFGYFTIQGNLIFTVVILLAAISVLTKRKQSKALVFARGAATAYMVVVGIVYNTLLTNVDVGVLVPWANLTLHLYLPIYAALDWLLFSDRPALQWKKLPLVLVYPLAWTAATLVRGATGWPTPFIPYPFLNPDRVGGYGGVAVYVLIVAIAFAVTAAVVWAVSRVKIIKV